MFPAPPDIKTEIFTRLPDTLRKQNTGANAAHQRGAGPAHSFLEGPSFDRDGNLWATDGQARDGKGNVVYKFSPQGTLLLTLGRPGVTGDGTDVFDGVCEVRRAGSMEEAVVSEEEQVQEVELGASGRNLFTFGAPPPPPVKDLPKAPTIAINNQPPTAPPPRAARCHRAPTAW